MINRIIITLFFFLSISLFAGNVTEEFWANDLRQNQIQTQPIKFIENKGQLMNANFEAVPFVLFKAEAPGMNVYITEKGLTYVFVRSERNEKEEHKINNAGQFHLPGENTKTEMAWVNVHLKEASINRENIVKEGQSKEHQNYFYGHCPQGIYDVYQYEKITIKDVYPGIDWVFYNSDKKGMKYDFIIHPGADPNRIKFIYESEKPLAIDRDGNIRIKTKFGTLTENAPYSYIQNEKAKIESRFNKKTIDDYNVEVTFQLPHTELPNSQTIIIDPQLVWATYYGGELTEWAASSTMDSFGNFYTCGYSESLGFPTLNSGTYYMQLANGGNQDLAILKFTNAGVLLWATYYGGTGYDYPFSMVCDISDNLFIAGTTRSANFPIQASTGYFDNAIGGLSDGFIIKFNLSGVRQWGTYYGGTAMETCKSITTDGSGQVYATGLTSSTDLPLVNAGGYFDNANPGSDDIFIVKFNATNVLLWSTYFGGVGYDDPWSIICDGAGTIYVSGMTYSINLPTLNSGGYFDNTLNGSSDCFILKFSASYLLQWSTYYGGSGDEMGGNLLKHANGNLYVAGSTSMSGGNPQPTDFNTLNSGGYYDNTPGGRSDVYILKFNSSESLLWATLFGGSGQEATQSYWSPYLETDNCGSVYLSFSTRSPGLFTKQDVCNLGYFQPTFSNPKGVSWQCNLFLIKFTPMDNILWATYIKGDGDDHVPTIVIDNQSNIFIGSNSDLVGVNNQFVNPGGGAYFDNIGNGGPPYAADFAIYKFSPIPSTINKSQTNSTSCVCNGTATVSLSCGVDPYTFKWSNGIIQAGVTSATSSISGLCAGTYTLTATSNCNQTQTTTFTITGPSCGGITAHASDTIICLGACAILKSNATGGSAPYLYSWSTGATTQNITPCPIATTTYTVKITDSGGATSTASATVIVLPPMIGQFAKGTAVCSGCGCKQWIMVTASGGTSPYSYSWPDGYTNRYKNQLCPGNYTVNIKDKNGCSVNVNLSTP